jgi:hypothetical protein
MRRHLEKLLTTTAACIIGASIICVDLIVRKFPGKRNFRIQDSDIFLSSSLSLSFGVMVRSLTLFSLLVSIFKLIFVAFLRFT